MQNKIKLNRQRNLYSCTSYTCNAYFLSLIQIADAYSNCFPLHQSLYPTSPFDFFFHFDMLSSHPHSPTFWCEVQLNIVSETSNFCEQENSNNSECSRRKNWQRLRIFNAMEWNGTNRRRRTRRKNIQNYQHVNGHYNCVCCTTIVARKIASTRENRIQNRNANCVLKPIRVEYGCYTHSHKQFCTILCFIYMQPVS